MMRGMSYARNILSVLAIVMAVVAPVVAIASDVAPGASPGPGTRYATDAYPGFDREESLVKPEKKEPKWFAFINGPVCDNAEAQFVYCQGLVADGNYSKAVKQLDALVREWPASPEAPTAQLMQADIRLEKLLDYEDAFAEYRYLLDFHSLQCDYDAIANRMYQVAQLMRQEGKTIVFFRFKNTVDVRRAFEACVLRAPGAKWAPQAMLTIGELRVEEGKYSEAIKVYENLRNIHPDTDEAKVAVLMEGECRMVLLREHGYNRDRCRDTIDYMRLALRNCNQKDVDQIKEWLTEARSHIEGEAFRAAKFYDSPTRTARSAINAYERYLAEYPDGVYAEEAKSRLYELKGNVK